MTLELDRGRYRRAELKMSVTYPFLIPRSVLSQDLFILGEKCVCDTHTEEALCQCVLLTASIFLE